MFEFFNWILTNIIDISVVLWIYFKNFYLVWIAPFWYIYVIWILFYIFKAKNESSIYGISIDLWEFGAWKTYNDFRDVLDLKRSTNCFVISNCPYYFTDLQFNSQEDLEKIFQIFVEYFQDTNYKEYLQSDKFRNIVFLLDESQLYFFSRNFMKNFQWETLISVTQCRKRNMKIMFITQELAQLDSTFRKLVPYVKKYYKWFWWLSFYREYYMKTDDVDVKNEDKSEIVGRWFFLTPWKLFWNIKNKYSKKYEQYHNEKWVSKYIVWLKKKLWKSMLDDFTYNDFIDKIYPNWWLNLLLNDDWTKEVK